MPDLEKIKARPGDLYAQMPAMLRAAGEQKTTVAKLLEKEDPSHEWTNSEDRAIGAFGRVLRSSGFIFASDPSEGMWADTYGEIAKSKEGRACIVEWTAAIWRRAINGGYQPQVRPSARILQSDDSTVGSALRPITDAAGVYNQDLEPGIRLADIVALTTPITGNTYRRTYLDDPAADQTRLLRIQETADIPRAFITISENINRLFKYGRGIEVSYEVIREVPIDKVGLWVAKVALATEAHRVAQALDVAINGDGNANTAAENFNQGTLDTGTTPTVKGLLAFKAKWRAPYTLTHIFAREAELLNLQLLALPNQNPLLIQIQDEAGFGALRPMQNVYGGVIQYGMTDAVAAGVYLGIDARWALERLTQIGSEVTETTRYVERQTEALFFTENDGFGVIDENVAKTWTMA